MSGVQTGPALLGPNGETMHRKAKDEDGRTFSHNATVEDVYKIAAKETVKVHEFYMHQIPPHVAKMLQDCLIEFGLVKIVAGPDGQPMLVGIHQEAPVVSPVSPETPSGDTPSADSISSADDARGINVEAEIEGRVITIPPAADPIDTGANPT